MYKYSMTSRIVQFKMLRLNYRIYTYNDISERDNFAVD